MYDLEDAVRQRRSIRMFLPDRPVPRESIDEALDLAIRAPSNSNIQPWHVVFASGAARDRLVAALLEAAQAAPPKVPALPEHFSHFRSETGKVVYGSMGIARDDVAARRAAVLRNWEFFRAPLAGIVCMDRELGLAGYPEIIYEQLNIPEQFTILCGLAVGYPDPNFPANKIRVGRQPIEKNVIFVDD
jgi:nitroreductase